MSTYRQTNQRRPKKSIRLEIRITKAKAEQLKRCAERLKLSKADVIERGIDLVDKEK